MYKQYILQVDVWQKTKTQTNKKLAMCQYWYNLLGHLWESTPPAIAIKDGSAQCITFYMCMWPTRPHVQFEKLKFFAQLDRNVAQVSVMKYFSFWTRPGLYILWSLCLCVYTVLQDTPAQYVSPSVLSALCTAAGGGCVQAESPTETTTTHIKGVPLQEYDYQPLSYEPTSPPSVTASLTGMGRKRRKKRWFSKYKLTTNWSLTHLFFPILLNISLFLFNSIYLKLYTIDAQASPLRHSHQNHSSQSLINPSDPPHHITASWFQSHCSHSSQWVLYLQQLLNLKILNQCDRLVPACYLLPSPIIFRGKLYNQKYILCRSICFIVKNNILKSESLCGAK